MKQFLKKLLFLPMCLVSKLYTYSFSQDLRYVRDVLYTLWIRNFVGSMGVHSLIAKPCSLQGNGQMNIVIGDYTSIQGHSVLGCWKEHGHQHFNPFITIGNHCNIGEYNHITACNKIVLGDGLLTGRFVYIGDNSHGEFSLENASTPPVERDLVSKGEIIIGNNVWIGDKVTILAGVHIGHHVIIAANAVVTKSVPDNCVVAGVPAKIIKTIAKCQNQD